jgi:hypothetical protein
MDNEKYLSILERYVTAHEKLATHIERLVDTLARGSAPDFKNLVMGLPNYGEIEKRVLADMTELDIEKATLNSISSGVQTCPRCGKDVPALARFIAMDEPQKWFCSRGCYMEYHEERIKNEAP